MAGKRVQNLFESVVDFEHLHKSAWQARRGITLNSDTARFFYELESNLLTIQHELIEQTYKPQSFRSFVIQDPKVRLIQAAPFRDRVVHHALCSVLQPHLERSYFADSYACQKGKGNHKAVHRVQHLLRRFTWVGKIDIHHFFESLHHPTLYRMLERRIADDRVISLTKAIISHGHSRVSTERGVPIGNLTSQHFANFYLDALDHYIIEQTPVLALVRYMDDVIIFANTKRDVVDGISLLDGFVQDALHLSLKDNQTHIRPSQRGIEFLGFAITPSGIRFDSRRRRRFGQKWRASFHGKNSDVDPVLSMDSLLAWSEQANTVTTRKNLLLSTWVQRV